MSPRAAARLESLGFQDVYDYVAGEADWTASGLPIEGTNADLRHAGALARRDLPTCRLDEDARDVMSRVCGVGWDACAVVNDDRVVLGLLRCNGSDAMPGMTVEQRMESGPSTFRPDARLDRPLSYMRRHDLASVLVTRSDGRLVGLLLRESIERVDSADHA